MAAASQIRRINQRKIIRVMMRVRSTSRVQLAKATGMSQATVGRIVDDLLEQAILTEGDARPGGDREGEEEAAQLGRPSMPLTLDAQRRRFMAVQVGPTQTRLAALPLAVSQEDEWPVQIATPSTPERWAKAVAGEWERLAPKGLEAVVVSLPGVVDEHVNRVLLSPNLRWTERADIPAMIRAHTRAPVVFVQEIRALALGQLAADPGLDDFLLVDFGSGVGAAAVIGGKLYRGPLPLSGELGHTPVVGNGRPCGCGSVGCVETLVSRQGLVATARENGGAGTWDELVADVARAGVPAWMAGSLDAAATTIAGALNVLGLRHVVITGGMEQMPSAFEYLCAAVRRGAMWGRFGEVTCTASRRRRMAGMVSAAIDRLLLSDGPG